MSTLLAPIRAGEFVVCSRFEIRDCLWRRYLGKVASHQIIPVAVFLTFVHIPSCMPNPICRDPTQACAHRSRAFTSYVTRDYLALWVNPYCRALARRAATVPHVCMLLLLHSSRSCCT